MPQGPVQRKADFLVERRAGTPSTFRYVAFHLRVLRAGWGILLFLFVFVVAARLEASFVQLFRPRIFMQAEYMSPHDILDPLLALGAVLIATFVPSLLEQRHSSDYALRGSPWKNGAVGFFTSLVLVAVAEVSLHAAGLMQNVGALPPPSRLFRQTGIWLGIMLMLGLLEELLTRGYLQYTLTRGLAFLYRRFLGLRTGMPAGFWTAAILMSAAFAWLYRTNTGQTDRGLAGLFVMGLLYSLSLWRTGDLWWAIGFHAAWDFAQAYVFAQWSGGLPVRDRIFSWTALEPYTLTGGHAGLDGSYLLYPLLLLAALSLLFLKKSTPYPELWKQPAPPSPDRIPAP